MLALGDKNGTVQIWNISSKGNFYNSRTEVEKIKSVAFHPNGQIFALGKMDGNVEIWDTINGEILYKLEKYPSELDSIQFSSDGLLLVSANKCGAVCLWELISKKIIHIFKKDEYHPVQINAAAAVFSPDNQLIASVDQYNNAVQVWDVLGRKGSLSREPFYTLTERRDEKQADVAFSPNNKWLATAAETGIVRLWESATRTMIYKFDVREQTSGNWGCNVAFSSDSKMLASSFYNTIWIWEVVSGKILQKFQGHTEAEAPIRSIVFSPDEDLIASAGYDQTVRVWNLKSSQPVIILKGHLESINNLAWHINGYLLTAGSTSIKCWHRLKKDNYLFFELKWSITINEILNAEGCQIEQASLSFVNARLLKQRGAIGEPYLTDQSEQKRIILTNKKNNTSFEPEASEFKAPLMEFSSTDITSEPQVIENLKKRVVSSTDELLNLSTDSSPLLFSTTKLQQKRNREENEAEKQTYAFCKTI